MQKHRSRTFGRKRETEVRAATLANDIVERSKEKKSQQRQTACEYILNIYKPFDLALLGVDCYEKM